jgi:gamma-glutamyl-gamma-aminobutyrate hydrolase PuuD
VSEGVRKGTRSAVGTKTAMSTSIDSSLVIGITVGPRYENYERWMLNGSQLVRIIRLSYELNNLADVENCHGILLSGGEDIHPCRYGRADLYNHLSPTEIDENRDEFEWHVIEQCLKLRLPILGICRGRRMILIIDNMKEEMKLALLFHVGMQLLNVYQGGTLIHDIFEMKNIMGHSKVQGIDDC